MKYSKFSITKNPIVDDGRVFIVHLRDPVIIAEVFHFDLDQEAEWMACKGQFNIAASVDYPGELIVLGVIFCAPDPPKWAGLESQAIADRLAKIMSRIGDWYHNYLKWEDEQEKERRQG